LAPTRATRLIELESGGRERGDGLERGERGEGEYRQRHPGERAVPGGRDAQQQDRPESQAGNQAHQSRAQPRCRGGAASEPGQLGVRGVGLGERGLFRSECLEVGRPVEEIGNGGGESPPGGRARLSGPAGDGRPGQRHGDAGGQQPGGQYGGRRGEDEQARGHGCAADHHCGQQGG
jgi:hypothetical protein